MALPLGAFALVLMLLMGYFAEAREREVIGAAFNRIAERISIALEHQLTERVQDVTQLAWLSTAEDYFAPAAARRLYENRLARQPAFAWIGFAGPDGRILAGTGNIFTNEIAEAWPLFHDAIHGLHLEAVHQFPELDDALGLMPDDRPASYLGISMGLEDIDGKFQGILLSRLRMSWVDAQLRTQRMEPERANGMEVFILDRDGRIVSDSGNIHPTPSFHFLPPATDESAGSSVTDVRWGESEPTPADHRRYIYTWIDNRPDSLMRQIGWRVVVRQPSDIALNPVREQRLQLGFVATLLTLGTLMLAWILARSIARPLEHISAAAGEVARGESLEIPHDSHLGEVQRLTEALQHMINSLTRSEEALDRMHTLAYRDTLTGLHNRRALELQIETAEARNRRSGEVFAVLALDLDGFKPVNDNYGHAAGDALLREVATRLRAAVRREEMLARIGGDEFVVLIVSSPQDIDEDARIVGQRILRCFEPAFVLEAAEVRVGCSIGLATGQPGDTPESLLPRADQALYEAKRSGRGQIRIWQQE